ncbi:MAG: hypothetical protein CL844_03510 [Crocinitomicaceae bacterium]|nr:hypothetical protein [Crocinitomicaceae bacterium]
MCALFSPTSKSVASVARKHAFQREDHPRQGHGPQEQADAGEAQVERGREEEEVVVVVAQAEEAIDGREEEEEDGPDGRGPQLGRRAGGEGGGRRRRGGRRRSAGGRLGRRGQREGEADARHQEGDPDRGGAQGARAHRERPPQRQGQAPRLAHHQQEVGLLGLGQARRPRRRLRRGHPDHHDERGDPRVQVGAEARRQGRL